MKFSALALLCLAAVTFAAPIVQDQDLSLEKREPFRRRRPKPKPQPRPQQPQKQPQKQPQQQQPKGSKSESITNGATAGAAVTAALGGAAAEGINLSNSIQSGQQPQGSASEDPQDSEHQP